MVRTKENLVNSTFCGFSWEKLTKCSPNPSLVNKFLATPRGHQEIGIRAPVWGRWVPTLVPQRLTPLSLFSWDGCSHIVLAGREDCEGATGLRHDSDGYLVPQQKENNNWSTRSLHFAARCQPQLCRSDGISKPTTLSMFHRERKMRTNFLHKLFEHPQGDIPAKFPAHARCLSSKPKEDKLSREGTNFSATTPSRGRPPPHRVVSDPKS